MGPRGDSRKAGICSVVLTQRHSRAGACQSQLLVPSTEGPTSTAYFCGDQLKLGKTLYRADPATTTGPSAGATGPSLSSTTASSSSPFTYGPAPGTPPPSAPSRTWIAGAVLAPLILSVLLGLGLCLWLRRGRRRRRAAEEDGAKSVGDSSREDVAFYYNQDMKLDLRESTGPWSPYSSRFGSLRTANEGDRPASHHELAGDRSTQVYLELPDMNSPPAVELPAGSIKKVAKRAGRHVHY
ncbi:hypothetical protein IF2G_03230 [Cordyceps javanica]|nr:hypothetical protein IF2G_03230 [Cordyceps javanica]